MMGRELSNVCNVHLCADAVPESESEHRHVMVIGLRWTFGEFLLSDSLRVALLHTLSPFVYTPRPCPGLLPETKHQHL
jgi:hypothetical protein